LYNICEAYIHNYLLVDILMENIYKLLETYWFSEKQSHAFVYLYTYWAKPASSLAKALWEERTNMYKMLEILVRRWILGQTKKHKTKHFFVANKNILRSQLEEKKNELNKKELLLPKIETALSQLENTPQQSMPAMRFFEWESWIRQLFDDMQNCVTTHGYLQIKHIWSSTILAQSHTNKILEDYASGFFYNCIQNNVHIVSHLWEGQRIMEQLRTNQFIADIWQVPAWHGSVSIFIVWKFLYFLICKDQAFWRKIQSEELVELMHFVFKSQIGKK